MRNAVTTVTIRKEGGFDQASIQAAYDAFSDVIDRPKAERFKSDLMEAGSTLVLAVQANAPYDPKAKKFAHIRDSVFLSSGPADEPYVLVGVTHSKSPQGYWQEYGTKHEPARPFFRPAQQAVKNQMADIIIAGITRVIQTGS